MLTPPIPPPRKNNLPPKSSINTPPISNQGSVSQSNNIFKKELGYADMHKLKQNEAFAKKKSGLNSSLSKNQK